MGLKNITFSIVGGLVCSSLFIGCGDAGSKAPINVGARTGGKQTKATQVDTVKVNDDGEKDPNGKRECPLFDKKFEALGAKSKKIVTDKKSKDQKNETVVIYTQDFDAKLHQSNEEFSQSPELDDDLKADYFSHNLPTITNGLASDILNSQAFPISGFTQKDCQSARAVLADGKEPSLLTIRKFSKDGLELVSLNDSQVILLEKKSDKIFITTFKIESLSCKSKVEEKADKSTKDDSDKSKQAAKEDKKDKTDEQKKEDVNIISKTVSVLAWGESLSDQVKLSKPFVTTLNDLSSSAPTVIQEYVDKADSAPHFEGTSYDLDALVKGIEKTNKRGCYSQAN